MNDCRIADAAVLQKARRRLRTSKSEPWRAVNNRQVRDHCSLFIQHAQQPCGSTSGLYGRLPQWHALLTAARQTATPLQKVAADQLFPTSTGPPARNHCYISWDAKNRQALRGKKLQCIKVPTASASANHFVKISSVSYHACRRPCRVEIPWIHCYTQTA